MKKRIISLVLATFIVLGCIPIGTFCAFAESINGPRISVVSRYAAPDSTTTVELNISNNPGIAGAILTVSYDDKLTLLDAQNGEAFSALDFTPPGTYSSPCNFSWDSLDASATDDGVILTLSFKVAASVDQNAKLPIKVTYNNGDIFDTDMNDVNVDIDNGYVAIISYIPGDVNSDEAVNGKDVTLLRRYNAGGYGVDINEDAADVNDDDAINGKDVTLIRRYNAGGYNVELKPHSVKCQHVMTATEAVEATCTEDGNIAYWQCDKCGKYYSDNKGLSEITLEDAVVKALGHIIVRDEAVEPTETTPGLTEGSHCSRCGLVLSAQETIPPIASETHAIIYHAFDGDGYLESIGVQNDNPNYYSSAGLTLSPLTATGYRFNGWYDGEGEDSVRITKIDAGSTGTVHLYAHWTPIVYTIQYESDLIPVNDDTYTINQGKVLATPKLSGYSFVGWSDEDGNIIKRIPVGTTGHKTYSANWLSDRNQARTKKNVGEPIILEEDNKILFTYEIGEIRNVPVSVIHDFGKIVEGGIGLQQSVAHSKTVSSSEVVNYEKTVANATTENYGITLSNGWSEGTTVDREWCETHGMDEQEAIEYGTNDTDNWYVSSGKSGTTTTVTYNSAQETDMNTSTKNSSQTGTSGGSVSATHSTESHFDASLTESASATVSAEVEAKGPGVKAKAGASATASLEATQSFGGSVSNSSTVGRTFSATGSVSAGNTDQTGIVTHTGSDTTTSGSWNSESGRGGSHSVTSTKSTSKKLTETLSERTGYGSSYINTGSEASTQGFSSQDSTSEGYSTGVTFSTAESETITETISTTNTKGGYHRWVWATTAHVFLVVGYDIASSSYFTCNYSILDEEVSRFEDYSYDSSSYDDNQTGVISFDIPTDIIDYVTAKTSESEGLQYSRDGKVTAYYGNDDLVIIPEYKVINGTVIKVTSIAENAFKVEENLSNSDNRVIGVVLSDYITEIPDNAFMGCSALKYIYMKNVTSIGDNAFAGCTGLKVSWISEKVTYLGENAFEGLDGIVAYPSSKEIAEAAVSSGAKTICLIIPEDPDPISSNSDPLSNKLLLSKDRAVELFEIGFNIYLLDNEENYLLDAADEKRVAQNTSDILSHTDKFSIEKSEWASKSILDNSTLAIPAGTDFFGFYGSETELRTFNNVNITSDADITVISNSEFISTKKVPIQTSSSEVILAESSVAAPNFGVIFSAEQTDLTLYGESAISSTRGNAILTKNLSLNNVDDSLYDQLYLNGNILVFGSVDQNELITFTSGNIIQINDSDFEKYLGGMFTITFNPNGGNVDELERESYFGVQTELFPTPTREYYSFAGWFTENGTQAVNPVDLVDNDEDITLYAHWTVNSYTVEWSTGTGYSISVNRTSSPNGGASTGALKSKDAIFYGDVLAITYTASTGYTITSKGKTAITVTGNVTGNDIYATASPRTYTVTFNANGGSSSTSSKTVTYKSTYGSLPTPTKTGYNFTGWYTATSGGSQITSGTTVTITSNQTLYAHWSIIVVNVGSYVGWSYASAKSDLESKGINVSLSSAYNYNYGTNIVYQQSAAGNMNYGSTVTLYYSKGAKPFAKGDYVCYLGSTYLYSSVPNNGGVYKGAACEGWVNNITTYNGKTYIQFAYQKGTGYGWASADHFAQRTN